MPNTYVNKVNLADGTTLIDISADTVTASDVAGGVTFHSADGAARTGTAEDGDNLEYGSSGLVGTTWLFNSTFADANMNKTWNIDFISNSQEYTKLYITSFAGFGEMIMYDSNEVYTYVQGIQTGWLDQAYRTISITGGTDAKNADLIAWIEANATQLSIEFN